MGQSAGCRNSLCIAPPPPPPPHRSPFPRLLPWLIIKIITSDFLHGSFSPARFWKGQSAAVWFSTLSSYQHARAGHWGGGAKSPHHLPHTHQRGPIGAVTVSDAWRGNECEIIHPVWCNCGWSEGLDEGGGWGVRSEEIRWRWLPHTHTHTHTVTRCWVRPVGRTKPMENVPQILSDFWTLHGYKWLLTSSPQSVVIKHCLLHTAHTSSRKPSVIGQYNRSNSRSLSPSLPLSLSPPLPSVSFPVLPWIHCPDRNVPGIARLCFRHTSLRII